MVASSTPALVSRSAPGAPSAAVTRLVTRGRLVVAVGLLAGLLSLREGPAPSNDATALAAALSAESGLSVRPEDVRWEASDGVVGDLVLGRFALFLGSDGPGAPRDVLRARVRLTPEGRPLSVGRVVNLTSTPIGDDHSLVVSGDRAAFATRAFGQEQSVTLLGLAGEGAQNMTARAQDRWMAAITNLQQSGAARGVSRVDVTLDQPTQRVGLSLSPSSLDIALADDDRSRAPTRSARLDAERGELSVAAPGMHVQPAHHLPKRFVFWAVDTVRAVPWIGPAPVAWLEERVFAVKDRVKQTAFRVGGSGEALADPAVVDASQASADLGQWPPPAIRSILKTPAEGEGVWTVPKQPWIKRFPTPAGAPVAPSPFYTTFLRPDQERPYSKVLLVAMDMRQLDLSMEAGVEDPKPLTGPPGAGRIPRDPAVFKRIAAAFNGGFKTEHGSYGMMVRRRVLLPPVPGGATVVVLKDHRVGMGSWGSNRQVGGIVDVADDDILSFRQNLDPLVDNDKVNPLGRAQWGYTLPGTSMQTERTGICVTAAGHMFYAWGDDVSATVLGRAMKMAGCVYGMHLDMNPHHTGFLFTNITELKGKQYKSELLSTHMEIGTDRYIEYAPKDFFYMTLHEPEPPSLEGVTWEPSPGAQPAPSFMPGVWRGARDGVELLEVEPARATYRIRAGTSEPDARTGSAPLTTLGDEDAHRVLFSVTMGVATERHPRGLVTDGKVASALAAHDGTALLVATEEGALSVAMSVDRAPRRADVAELPLLFGEGHAPTVSASAARPLSALCVTAAGRTYVARGTNASDVTARLKDAGCERAVVLDRGAGGPATLRRAATADAPRARSEDTVLFAMAKPMVPRGFRFEAAQPVAPPPAKK